MRVWLDELGDAVPKSPPCGACVTATSTFATPWPPDVTAPLTVPVVTPRMSFRILWRAATPPSATRK